MANRMDIELTSARGDEGYTWRAAGARQPRGVVPSSVLPPGSKVGDVLRAEIEVEIDGITIVSILPPKEKAEDENRIEYIGPRRPPAGVTTVLASRPERRGRGRDTERAPRRREGERPPRRTEAGERAPRRTDAGERAERPVRSEEGGRRRSAAGAPGGERRPPEGRPRPGRDAPAGRPRRGPVRFEPGTAHRDELFSTFSPEQRAIAERLASGGLPAVRKALAEEQQRARSEGRPVVSGEPIIAIAEQLLPDVKAAVWLDRAEAAIERADEITLRDLRTTVVAAAPRDDTGRELERRLREALDRRVTKLRQDWEQHLTQAIEDGRILQALRLSAKPPEPTARFPGSLVTPLATQAGAAMNEEAGAERWLALLEAAIQSPVRRQIKPAGLPKDPSGDLERQARAAASRVPALARLLGMAIPPPPQPVPGDRPGRPARPTRRPGPGSGPRPQPRPTAPATSTAPANEPSGAAVTSEPPAPDDSGTHAEPSEPASEHPVSNEEVSETGDER